MDLHTQYIRALIISVSFFCTGVALIEFASTGFIRWCGRATVLMSIGVLAFYGYWATEQCAMYHKQIAGSQQRDAMSVERPATGIAKRDASADYSVTLQNGSTVSWSLNDGTLSGVHRRGWSVNTGRSASGTRIVGGTVAGSDELRNGGPNAGGTVWIGSEQTDGNQTF